MTLAELIVASLDEYDEARPGAGTEHRVSVVEEVLRLHAAKQTN